jgi:aryl-alcohol dehydrogenase-like predicted oxidoreductase
MEYRILGKTNLEVSAIGLGTATFGREIDEVESVRMLDHAFEQGMNLFDTAAAYSEGKAESITGRWLEQSGNRDQIILATKVHPPLTRKNILNSCEASLASIGGTSSDGGGAWGISGASGVVLGLSAESDSNGPYRRLGLENTSTAP